MGSVVMYWGVRDDRGYGGNDYKEVLMNGVVYNFL